MATYDALLSTADALALMPSEQRMEIVEAVKDNCFLMKHGRQLRNLTKASATLKVESELAVTYWVDAPTGESHTSLIETSTAAWADVVMYVGKLASIVVIDQDSIDDSDVDLFAKVKNQIAADIPAKIDGAALAGTNAPTGWPIGGIVTHATGAGNNVALGTGADLYDDVLGETAAGVSGVFGLIEADGYEVSAVAGAVSLKSKLRSLRDSNGNPIFNKLPGQGMAYELDGAPCEFPKHGGFPAAAAHLIAGDWNMAVWAMRKDLEFKVLTEGVVNDAAGNIVVNLGQEDCVAIRAIMRIGFALPNPVNQIQPLEANRSPFGVLTV
jgi:HK97 family phage major capsid protein